MFRRECPDQAPAAHCHLFLVKSVEPLTAFLPDKDQPGLLQLFEMVTDCRLVYLAIQRVDDVVDAQPDAAQALQDLMPGLVGQGLGKDDRIRPHAPIIYRFISICQTRDRLWKKNGVWV